MIVGTLRPFTAAVPDEAIADLRARLAMTRWPEKETVEDWDQGVPLAYAQELAEWWRTQHDWRACEAALNAWPQYLVEVDGLDIHIIHVRSENPAARPLILTHGWPGSVLEFLDVIPALSEDFHLVIASLPGYGFSGKPVKPGWSVDHIATAWDALMRSLGYPRYFAQGGDWGSAVTTAIGEQNLGACAGIHVNMIVARPTPEMMANMTPEEMRALARLGWYREKDTGYSIAQKTRPQTLGYGLADSPVGQMAWIVEKFHGWTDCGHAPPADQPGHSVGGHPERALSRARMLDTVSLYWFTNSAASSARLYWHSFGRFAEGSVEIPAGCSLFPWEIMQMSRRMAETRYRNISYWNALPAGGHFAAMEQPDLFVSEVKAAFATMTL